MRLTRLLPILLLTPLLWLARDHVPPLLQPECADAACKTTSTTTTTTTTTTAATTTTTLGDSAPVNWEASAQYLFKLDDSSGLVLTNDSTTACGGALTLTNTNTVAVNTSSYVEGNGSAEFTDASNNYLSVTDACTRASTSATWGGWVYVNATFGSDRYILGTNNQFDGGNGYTLGTSVNGNAELNCKGGNGTTVTTYGATNSLASGSWRFAACVFDDSADTLQPYLNGATTGSAGTLTSMTAGTQALYLATSLTGSDFTGYMDSMWMTRQVLTPTELCRIGACGWDGSYCRCDGGTGWKACDEDSDCGGSALCDLTAGKCYGHYRRGSGPTMAAACTMPTNCNDAAP